MTADLGEGLCLTRDYELWWVDIANSTLYFFSPAKNQRRSFKLPEIASKVLKVENGVVALASENGISTFTVATRKFETVYDQPPLSWSGAARSNDGCILSNGDIVVGRMDFCPKLGTGDLVRYGSDQIKIAATGIAIPNTFVEIEVGYEKFVLISDSMTKVTKAYSVDSLRQGVPKSFVWHDFNWSMGTPDGGLLASDGNVYIAMWGGSCIAVLTPDGQYSHALPVDVLQPTSLQEDPETGAIWATSARQGLSNRQMSSYPLSGQLVNVKIGGRKRG
ncbi:SMP-30/gluconolactonase/LRE family protein [Luminiphilus sp.]|nr:SMP-30/gluconolactonase/LRE family protein [Luminiphilus sp.]MDA8986211.1 SMP-30/gluconolactonase/LRE family protein [Luminiphilus sp.]